MHKTLASSLVATTIAVTLLFATADDASAQRGWWPGFAIGAITGAVVAGAIVASRPPGYVVYPGYAQPVYGPGCYWTSQPVYDGAGHIVGYTGQPVQVCPGYAGPR
jgi:hypothetical protein